MREENASGTTREVIRGISERIGLGQNHMTVFSGGAQGLQGLEAGSKRPG